MRKFNRVLLFCALVFCLILLPGCQDLLAQIPFLGPTPTMEAAATATTENPQTITIEPTLPSENLSKEITLWLPPQFDPENGTPAGNILKKQLELFTTDFPGINLEVRIKANSGPGGLLDSLTTASSAAPAVLPGIILLPRADFETAAENGLLFPVEAVDINLDESDSFEFSRDISIAKGIRYGLPFAADLLVFAYKPLQIGSPPRFWSGVFQQGSIVSFPAADPQGLTATAFYTNSGGTMEPNEDKVGLQESALQSSLKLINEGATNNIFPYWLIDINTFDQSLLALQDSKVTYSILWASQVLSTKTGEIAVSAIPALNENSNTLADGWSLAFPQTSPEQYADHLKLAEYLINPEFQLKWTEAAGMLPVNKSVLLNWNDKTVSSILFNIAETAQLLPLKSILEKTGPLLSNATQELIRKKVNYIEASNKILEELQK